MESHEAELRGRPDADFEEDMEEDMEDMEEASNLLLKVGEEYME